VVQVEKPPRKATPAQQKKMIAVLIEKLGHTPEDTKDRSSWNEAVLKLTQLPLIEENYDEIIMRVEVRLEELHGSHIR
jgi:hypothetical protein